MNINKNYLLPIISGIILFLTNINDKLFILLFIFLLPFLKFLDEIKKEKEGFIGGFLLGFIYYFLGGVIFLWPSQETWLYLPNLNSPFLNYIQLINPKLFLLIIFIFFSFLIGLIFGLFGYFSFIIYKKNKNFFIIYLPFLWLSCEYLKRKILFDLSWMDIGYNIIDYSIFAATASLWGRYGIAFFVILINILLFYSLTKKIKSQFGFLLIFCIFIVFNLLGIFIIHQNNLHKTKEMKIAVIQGYLPWQTERRFKKDEPFDFPYPYNYFFNQMKNEKNYVDIILLPEEILNSRPFYLKKIDNKLVIENEDEFKKEKKYVLEILEQTKARALVFGQKIIIDKRNNYNGFVIFTNNGEVKFYLKNRLFPFIEEERPFSLGLNKYQQSTSTPFIKINDDFSLLIMGCIEIETDSLANKYLNNDPSLILSGGSEIGFNQWAQKYQIKLAKFRAIEQNRYLARAVKSGFSSIIANNGQIIAQVESPKENKILIGDVYLIKNKTFYSKIAPFIENIIILFAFLHLVVLLRKIVLKTKIIIAERSTIKQ